MGPPASFPTAHHGDYLLDRLLAAKGRHAVSVCIPARDEEPTVGAVVTAVLDALGPGIELVDEVVVVDDTSSDDTAGAARRAGARVVTTTALLLAMGVDAAPGAGKGQAMWAAASSAVGDLLVFLDADVVDFGPHFVTGLLGPLLLPGPGAPPGGIRLVKGFYERPAGAGIGGGRVTELVARPVLSLLYPHLSAVRQPLAGETACTRSTFELLAPPAGYGVEIGMLVDVAARWGAGAVAQVDLGVRHHRNRPLAELAPQAREVLAVALARAGIAVQEPPPALPPLITLRRYRDRAGRG